jgi:predicted CoA-binding protein
MYYAASSTIISSTFLFFVVVVIVVISLLPSSSSVSVTAFSTTSTNTSRSRSRRTNININININMNMNNPETIRKVLINTKTIALIGASIKSNRPSNYVMKYLLDNGYNVIPINPGLKDGSEIHGQKVYDTLSSIPTHKNIDMVDIFRNSAAVPSIVDEILKMNNMDEDEDDNSSNSNDNDNEDNTNKHKHKHKKHNIKSIWMQVGVINEDAALKAKNSGLDVIMNACPKIEIPKLNINISNL